MAAECANFEVTRMARLLEVSTPATTAGGQLRAAHRCRARCAGPTSTPRSSASTRARTAPTAPPGSPSTSSRPATGQPQHRGRPHGGLGIVGVSPRLFKVTTNPDPCALPGGPGGPGLPPRGINRLLTSDITYLKVGDGEAYLCAVRDEGSSRVLGFAIADHMRTEIVLDALEPSVHPLRPGRAPFFIRTEAASSVMPRSWPLCERSASSAPWGPRAAASTTPAPRASGRSSSTSTSTGTASPPSTS